VLRVFELTSPDRNVQRDRALGSTLAFVAGATNAGGFLAVGQYTSHMTGIVSALADDLALAHYGLAVSALGALVAFLMGAMTTAITVNWGRRHQLQSRFAMPLVIEAVLLLAFGLLSRTLANYTLLVAPLTVLVLCFMMGLQNAVITKISGAVIRTTHVTGLLTDIGIELGRALYINRGERGEPVRANRERLGVHLLLFWSFLIGGIAGGLGFSSVGPITTLPLAALLLFMSVKPVLADLLPDRVARRKSAGERPIQR
jgi:uncharacterized membrane protein YoaK (UPF0700 family)